MRKAEVTGQDCESFLTPLQTTVILGVISSPKNYVLGIYHAEGLLEALNRDSKHNCPNSYFHRETDDEQGK